MKTQKTILQISSLILALTICALSVIILIKISENSIGTCSLAENILIGLFTNSILIFSISLISYLHIAYEKKSNFKINFHLITLSVKSLSRLTQYNEVEKYRINIAETMTKISDFKKEFSPFLSNKNIFDAYNLLFEIYIKSLTTANEYKLQKNQSKVLESKNIEQNIIINIKKIYSEYACKLDSFAKELKIAQYTPISNDKQKEK